MNFGAILNDVTGGFLATQLPFGGTVRAGISWEITGLTNHTYYLTVLYGPTGTGGSGIPLPSWWGISAAITGFGQSRLDNLDVPFTGVPPGTYDAIVYVSDGFDSVNRMPTGTLYDSKLYTGAVQVQQSAGATIVNVTFSSV